MEEKLFEANMLLKCLFNFYFLLLTKILSILNFQIFATFVNYSFYHFKSFYETFFDIFLVFLKIFTNFGACELGPKLVLISITFRTVFSFDFCKNQKESSKLGETKFFESLFSLFQSKFNMDLENFVDHFSILEEVPTKIRNLIQKVESKYLDVLTLVKLLELLIFLSDFSSILIISVDIRLFDLLLEIRNQGLAVFIVQLRTNCLQQILISLQSQLLLHVRSKQFLQQLQGLFGAQLALSQLLSDSFLQFVSQRVQS